MSTGCKNVMGSRAATILLLLGATGTQVHASAPADLVVLGARVWTGLPAEKEPTAIAVMDGKIVAVGSDQEIQERVGPGTRTVGAGGRRVIPGITDSHTHIVGGGLQLDRLNLRDTANRAEFVHAVADAAANKKPGQWLQGGRWSVESWPEPESPTRDWLDPVTGERPVFLTRMDGHQALVNTAALRVAGITADTKDPVGGEIERDPRTGEATGVLKESAMELVRMHIPPLSADDRREALHRAMRHANSLGVTSVQDMSDPADIPVFAEEAKRGTLTVRITSYIQTGDWLGALPQVRSVASRHDGDWFQVAGLKGYMDGSLGSRTARMGEPYHDTPHEHPYPLGQFTAFAADPMDLQKAVSAVHRAGLQMAVHAIGDEANHRILDAYAGARTAGGPKTMHRVEHAQHLFEEDIPRFAEIGVVASMQPYHKADDGRYAERRIGQDRLAGSYAFRQLVDHGALVCFGSDWPVVTLNPFAGVDAAVTARTLDGKIWLADHSLTVFEAIRAYTVSPPRAIGRADRLGTIEVGKLADLAILEADPFSIAPERLPDVRVWATVVGGKLVYQAPD